MHLTAVAAAVVTALLVLPAAPRLHRSPRGSALRGGSVLAATAVGVVGAAMPHLSALVVIGVGVVAAGFALVRRRSRRREAAVVAARVLETCELLAAELASGQPPGQSLRRAAEVWPVLSPAAEAFDLGGDVPHALRGLATDPGAGDFRLVAAAWAVAHRTGHGLGESLRRCAESLRSAQAMQRVVEGELASARATARLVAALPVLALLMGAGAGGSPVSFLLGQPLGLACLAGGLGFGFAGLWWIESIAGDVEVGR